MSVGNRGGRPRKPTALHKLQGTERPDRANPAEPRFQELSDLTPPPWLDAVAAAHFAYYVSRLTSSGVITDADVDLLAAASERWSVYRRAALRLRRAITGKNRFNERVGAPENQIAHRALADYWTLMREFGIGPASRSKVTAAPAAPEDEFDSFLRGRAHA